jgi:response regulator RpfG family c-di-GMP phosphodiesterase
MMDNNKFTILCVDDEQSILNALKRLLRKEGYNLLFANSGQEGLEILKDNEVHMVVSDQRMPEMSGTDFLAAVKDSYPDVRRVILTGYSDIESITESINKGHIYKFFSKPWNDLALKAELRQILDQFELKQDNRQLAKTVAEQNEQLSDRDGKPDTTEDTQIRELKLQNHMLQLSHAILENLPISVLGIDIEGVIVTANKMALKRLHDRGVKVGCAFRDFFPEEVLENVRRVFETGEQILMNGRELGDCNVEAALMPLSGPFKGKGVIMTMNG